jgi:uncharacterized membrane protein YphA (DoxX/SURF4 family)
MHNRDTRRITTLQLFLRIALSASFLSAVADRFGFWSAANSSWGDWEHFVAYSQTVNSFAGPQTNNILAIVSTALEILLPIFLLTGYKTKFAAIASGIMLLSFALAMTYSLGIKSSLDYSVWTAAAASFALSTISNYRYSIDYLISKRRNKKPGETSR